jgi:hypothetical protein
MKEKSSLPLPSSCVFLFSAETCAHPVVHGATDAARCASCAEYRGSSRGLGDVVHSVAVATGIDAVARKVGCGGCAQRRAALNAAVPFTDTDRKG